MRPKKALKILKDWKSRPITEVEKAIDTAVKVLPYCVDMKPSAETNGDKTVYFCPVCGVYIRDGQEYCHDCGQSIGWED